MHLFPLTEWLQRDMSSIRRASSWVRSGGKCPENLVGVEKGGRKIDRGERLLLIFRSFDHPQMNDVLRCGFEVSRALSEP
jgi:hypothetical protein